MARSTRLRLNQVRQVFRLLGEAGELRHDPQGQKQRVVDGLVKLTGADTGLAFHFAGWQLGRGDEPRITSFMPGTATDGEMLGLMDNWAGEFSIRDDPFYGQTVWARPQRVATTFRNLVPPDLTPRYQAFADLIASCRVPDLLVGYFRHHDGTTGRCVSLQYRGRDRAFSERHHRLLELFVHEWDRLYRAGKLDPPPSPAGHLPPRQREVYDRLIAGRSPKAIAFDLDLSIHTVREHMAAIYRCFDVAGREELMAYVIRRLRGDRA